MSAARPTLKVAAAQYPVGRPSSLDAWADGITRWVAEAAEAGAELLVFPEYGALELASTFGPEMEADLAGQIRAVGSLIGQVDALHVDLARRHGVHILAASLPVLAADLGGMAVNRARLIGPQGGIGIQDKRIMTPWERETWGITGNSAARVFDTELGRIGVAICYDGEFPLIVRAMVAAGAELILIPSATETIAGAARVRTAALARALENQVPVITSPTIGEAPWSPALDMNHGSAGVFVPADIGLPPTGILAEGTFDRPGWVQAEIDFAPIAAVRESGGVRGRRDWLEQVGAAEADAAAAAGVEIVRIA
ncbi:carbon-nitrogen hydrolase family protein [Thalassobaculum sp. OXR-137]|uniref:carbon-nitrogen hydrolase family protein n=1 Tax=Thalassobaculum sp. OXR-137 TaxID=3100173 RepID=UPI002AC8E3E6|nr:carbon-nitrogen hydrolase family protein [Thalassobaculum sp. OXR-137]WPZ35260.1 carbon-nitrogen hydrolase family protein [Thalassobaculum sp. OXR-137]